MSKSKRFNCPKQNQSFGIRNVTLSTNQQVQLNSKSNDHQNGNTWKTNNNNDNNNDMVILRTFTKKCFPVARIITEMDNHCIVPDILTKPPKSLAQVYFVSGVKADLGNILTPTQVKEVPTLRWKADPKRYYTVSMVDPDAPSRCEPLMREWRHWLVGNVRGENICGGQVLTEYIGAAPPKGSSFHRYVFLVFKQHEMIKFEEPYSSKNTACGREKFSTKDFSEKYKLGHPIAGNFFQAEWDDHVPVIYEQLGINI